VSLSAFLLTWGIDLVPVGSPHSTFSRIDFGSSRGKAEQVLQVLVAILSEKQYYTKFVAALPLTRICLLLLGNSPSPTVAAQVLKLLDISIGFSTSFIRKFELVSGWNVLKTILPSFWNAEANDAAFTLLIGMTKGSQDAPTIQCPQILPTILMALRFGLSAVASVVHVSETSDTQSIQLSIPSPASEPGSRAITPSPDQAATIEALTEELLSLHSTIPLFRSAFQSHNTTQLFIDGYKTFVNKLTEISEITAQPLRILEKLTHFGLALALDNSVAGSQKREVRVLSSAFPSRTNFDGRACIRYSTSYQLQKAF
jgi:hypothetical protein